MTAPNTSDVKLLAALDLGSNSFHLSIARVEEKRIVPVQRFKQRIRLGAGLDEQQELSNESIMRAVECLEKVSEMLSEMVPDKVRVVATHTIRVAKNRNTFLLLAEQVLGYPIEVISGREEARLIYQGVVGTESLDDAALVIDIGGGSTELAVGQGADPAYSDSRSMGCVSFSQRFFSDRIDADAFHDAHIAALQLLEVCSYRIKRHKWKHALATSGTAKALCKSVKLVGDTKGYLLLSDLLALREMLCQPENLVKLSLVGVDEKRAAVLPGGLAIMIAVMKSLGIESLKYSEAALREGVLYEIDQLKAGDNTRLRTRHDVQTKYQVDRRYAQLVAETCDHLYQQLVPDWKLEKAELHDLLIDAAHLHEVGLQINTSDIQEHSGYILAHCDLPGYNQEEQQVISFLVGSFRKRLKPEVMPRLRSLKQKTLLRLARLLRIAVLFNNKREPLMLDLLKIQIKHENMELIIDKQLLKGNEAIVADVAKESKLMSKAGFQLSMKVNEN